MRLTKEQKEMRKEFAEIEKELDKKAGRDKIKHNNAGDPDFSYRSFVIFDGTEVSEGGWMIGRKWMTAKYMSSIVRKWVMQSYETRADTYLKQKFAAVDIEKLREINKKYDLSAGCGQCGGCRWFAAIDGDYGFCFNEDSPNEGKITFEHGGCIQHSFIQKLLSLDT